MTDPDLNIKGVIDALDSFYCHNVVAVLWADAVANRLQGIAIYLLSDELPEVADHARAAARRLADRIGDLGGAITADPRQLLDRAPGNYEFTIPDCSDPRAITSYALQRLDVIIAAYQAFLDKIRGRDDVSFALVVGLLATETHRRADVAAAWGVANTGGNAGGIITQPLVGFLTNGGAWGGAFITGTVFASTAAALWLLIDPERPAEVD